MLCGRPNGLQLSAGVSSRFTTARRPQGLTNSLRNGHLFLLRHSLDFAEFFVIKNDL